MKTSLLTIAMLAAFTSTTHAQDALTDGKRIARLEGAYTLLATLALLF